ncbi:WecB/TagA/CpsF family glycosyltransferase [Candidatus Woesearchaeota archaeon]|nr:WecB/TagA/CpsF family glycosyltransferase [Candidatus Woesearchaeota archaeon]
MSGKNPDRTTELMGVNFENLVMEEAVEESIKLLAQRKSTVFFLNADCLYKAQSDDEYRGVLNSADIVLPDGIGLSIAMRIFGKKLNGNCNGTDFSPLFLERLPEKHRKIFLLGGTPGVAEKAAASISEKISTIKVVGTHEGYFDDDNEVIRQVNESGADILFVAMGVPKQEKWIHEHRKKLNPRMCLGVGALLDFWSGKFMRAPLIIRKLRMEWFWRLCLEPGRMFKRYIIDSSKFYILVLKKRFKSE